MVMVLLKMMFANIIFGKLEAMATNSGAKSATFPFSRRTSQTLFLKGRFFVKRRTEMAFLRAFCSSGRRLEKPAIRPTCRGKRFPDLGGGQIRQTFRQLIFLFNTTVHCIYAVNVYDPHVLVK